MTKMDAETDFTVWKEHIYKISFITIKNAGIPIETANQMVSKLLISTVTPTDDQLIFLRKRKSANRSL